MKKIIQSLHPDNFVKGLEIVIESRILLYFGLLFFLGFSTTQFGDFINSISRIVSDKFDNGLLFAVGIETGVFILATLGKTEASKGFAIVSGISQLLSFHRWEEVLPIELYNNPVLVSEAYTKLVGSIIISVMSPGAVWYFSELIKEKRREGKVIIELSEREQQLTELLQKITDREQKLTAVHKEERDASRAITELNKQASQLKSDLEELEEKKAQITGDITSLQKSKAAMSRFKNAQRVNSID